MNGDKYLDAYELEAIFQYELDKIYDPEKVSLVSIIFGVITYMARIGALIPKFKDDLREMEEERANMREHVMKEVDTDRDGAVSLDEFIKVLFKKIKNIK